jgi:large subunit ribosomal protein L5e
VSCRYQTKFRRRNEGKTDYRARKRLVVQDKNKYAAPRYRLVARLTNKYVIAQVVRSELDHDVVVAAAYSSELPRYGIKFGLKNYAAAYATGLLVARRLLASKGLADTYKGNEKVTAEIVKTKAVNDAGKSREHWVKEVVGDKKPFRAVLDVGIRPTTTGARVFGVMKGASDGGLDIPHNAKRFPGYNRDNKSYKADVHRERIFGLHVASYMEEMKAENAVEYTTRFSSYVAADADPEEIEEIYQNAHASIRKDPSAKTTRKAYKVDKSFKKPGKSTNEERKARVATKMANRLNKLRAAIGATQDDE